MTDRDYNPNKLNIYVCDNCGGHIVTRDMVPDGVTPFRMSCYSTTGCRGTMTSSMYRVFDPEGHMHHSHEWYRPVVGDVIPANAVDHVNKGGLLLRTRLDSKANLDAGFKPTHKHKKTGGSYQQIGLVGLNLKHDRPYPMSDGPEPMHKLLEDIDFVLYLSSTGKYWARPTHEFAERFDAIQ